MRKTTINKIICDFAFVMSIMIIIVCIPSFSVQAKEQNPLYSYVDSKTDLCGFVDKNGKVVIDPAYDTVCDFSDGLQTPGVTPFHKTIRFQISLIVVPSNVAFRLVISCRIDIIITLKRQ